MDFGRNRRRRLLFFKRRAAVRPPAAQHAAGNASQSLFLCSAACWVAMLLATNSISVNVRVRSFSQEYNVSSLQGVRSSAGVFCNLLTVVGMLLNHRGAESSFSWRFSLMQQFRGRCIVSLVHGKFETFEADSRAFQREFLASFSGRKQLFIS